MINFTRREIETAWKNNFKLYKSNRSVKTNSHRLMLFYAVECGLKAVIMRRRSIEVTDSTIVELGHNVNKMLDELRVERLKIPANFRIKDIKEGERRCTPEKINQIWRYGHKFNKTESYITENDESLEKKLIQIVDWIERELPRV